MNSSKKYNRSLHAPISLGTTSDDRFMPRGYLKTFAKMDLVLTEKLDGQNNCFSKNGVFARSHTSSTQHPWDKPMRQRWELIKNDLDDIEIFGENMYGVHSIGYQKLESYFYVFAVRQNERWLSWEEVKFYASMFDFPCVPEIPITTSLSSLYYDEKKNEDKILEAWFVKNLGMDWKESVETQGLLGGYDPLTSKPCSEGFVIRNAKGFTTNEGEVSVSSNEFNNLFKLVRESHVKTDTHWSKTWKEATLIDYEKYGWYAYSFLKGKK